MEEIINLFFKSIQFYLITFLIEKDFFEKALTGLTSHEFKNVILPDFMDCQYVLNFLSLEKLIVLRKDKIFLTKKGERFYTKINTNKYYIIHLLRNLELIRDKYLYEVDFSQSTNIYNKSNPRANEFAIALREKNSSFGNKLYRTFKHKWKNCSILDIGGGLGQISLPFSHANKITIIETKDFLSMNKDILPKSIKYIEGDYRKVLNFKKKFDIIICANILHQNTNKEIYNILDNIKKILSFNGQLVIIDFFSDNKNSNLFSLVLSSYNKNYHVLDFKTTNCMLSELNFEPKEIANINYMEETCYVYVQKGVKNV